MTTASRPGATPTVLARGDTARWTACALIVTLLHASIALAMLPSDDETDAVGGVPVVMIELAPVSAAPTTAPTDLAPGPHQVTPEQQQDQSAPSEPDKKSDETERVPEADTAAAVVLPHEREQTTPTAPPQESFDQPAATAPPSATALAARPAVVRTGESERVLSTGVARWQTLLVAQIEKNKRYPAAAKGRMGTARVSFTIDSQGRLVAHSLVSSSGNDSLDAEALAILARAAPFPAPPQTGREQLTFVVPIRFLRAASR